MIPEQIGWVAGLLEGEGSIYFCGKTGVTAKISMSDHDVVDRIFEAVGLGSVFTDKSNMRTWRVGKRDEVIFFLHQVLPWMGFRRTTRILEALERLKTNPGQGGPIEHGTLSGYHKERHRGLHKCDPCRLAFNNSRKIYWRNKKK